MALSNPKGVGGEKDYRAERCFPFEFLGRNFSYRQEGASGLADAAPAGKRVNMDYQGWSNDLAKVLLS